MKLTMEIWLVTLFCAVVVYGIPTSENHKYEEHITEDDSDMLMEPSDFHPSVLASHPTYYQRQNFRPFQNQFGSIERSSDDIAVDPQPQAAQNFLPSFFRDVQPLGHSRPYYSQDTHRFNANRQYDQSILGSGDFGVIRGGTFYQDNDPPIRGLESNDYYSTTSFYKNNGHGHGPQAAPYTQAKFNGYGDDQFSNFRDFADINTPTDPAYSHFVVVYANKNSTSNHPNPKNIFEQLQLLDEEKAQEKQKKSSISKIKKKLTLTKLEKKYKKKLGPKEGEFEPLLALS